MSYVVHIIESPSEEDFLDDRSEGRVLKDALTHAGLPVELHTVVNEQMLSKALVKVATSSAAGTPVLHLSMHGDTHGVLLTSGESLTWEQLAVRLGLVHSLAGSLWLAMSTCRGLYGAIMAYHQKAPFTEMVGAGDDISWQDTVAVFTAFYHHVARHGGTAAVALH